MSGYTKADYDSLYSIRVVLPDGRRTPIRLHYHRYVMQDIVRKHWDHLVPLLDINEDDDVIVVGAGFGWGIERLQELSGCYAIGTDISPYIQESKSREDLDEVYSAIVSQGYSTTEGIGQEVWNSVLKEPEYCLSTILNEDMMSEVSRANVVGVMDAIPSYIITEDMLSDFTDAEVVDFATQMDTFECKVVHIVRTGERTLEDYHRLTGHQCISCGCHRSIG